MLLAAYLCFIPLVLSAPPTPAQRWDPECGRCGRYTDCGNEDNLPFKSGKVVGGKDARLHEFPWQVSLRNVGGTHWCGGSLVTPTKVITAAHCMIGETAENLEVVVGEHHRFQNNSYKAVMFVSEFFNHPDYDGGSYENDISVITLREPVTISEGVSTVCAPEADQDYVNQSSVVSGWGTLESGGLCCPLTLKYTVVDVMTNDDCDDCFTLLSVTDDMICGGVCGDNKRDTCQGDSGGPMTVSTNNGNWTLIGVVSWGNGCAGSTPGVYSRVSYNLEWLDEQINNEMK